MEHKINPELIIAQTILVIPRTDYHVLYSLPRSYQRSTADVEMSLNEIDTSIRPGL